jgi:hypothetical protein
MSFHSRSIEVYVLIFATVWLLAVIALRLADTHVYGFPGQTQNGGVVVAGHGFELWPAPGGFREVER